MKNILLFGVVTLFSASAAMAASVNVVSSTDVYKTVQHYDNVQVTSCSKGDDKTTEGAIIGGLIGSQEGKAGLGALLGGIIGDQIGQEKCTTRTERRPSYEEKVLIGKDVTISVDGVIYTIKHRN